MPPGFDLSLETFKETAMPLLGPILGMLLAALVRDESQEKNKRKLFISGLT